MITRWIISDCSGEVCSIFTKTKFEKRLEKCKEYCTVLVQHALKNAGCKGLLTFLSIFVLILQFQAFSVTIRHWGMSFQVKIFIGRFSSRKYKMGEGDRRHGTSKRIFTDDGTGAKRGRKEANNATAWDGKSTNTSSESC
jgi:hypothetical protein